MASRLQPVSEPIAVSAAAKLNLSLAVLARRPDGFHEIESLVVPVSLHDTVHVRATAAPGIRLRVRFGGRLATPAGKSLAVDVPTDGTNLVVRAARMLADEVGIGVDRSPGLEIDLVKRIPSGSGLGGGSSDAAAVLMAAVQAWNVSLPRERLAAIGARIGSDVPLFFAGGAALVAGRGERIEPVVGIPALHAVIARPVEGLSTAAVYGRCVPEPDRRGQAAALAAALAAGRFRGALPLLHNSLEAPAREMCEAVRFLIEQFEQAGAARPLLTGSGSACFALVRSAAEARGIAAWLDAAGWPGVFAVRLRPQPLSVRPTVVA
jgi:4-diphosphocytidyl-2-C-methyl-D-erythritol kinase